MESGHYARKQLSNCNPVIAWGHRARFALAAQMVREFTGKDILDFGCGDGTFLGLAFSATQRPRSATGAEIDQAQVEDCRFRWKELPNIRCCFTKDLFEAAGEPVRTFDAVFCMEVLEHVVKSGEVLDQLVSLTAPSGSLIISVPVETGLSVMIKQAARHVAGLRHRDYRFTSRYSAKEMWRSIFASDQTHIQRPIYGAEHDGIGYHDHKGFNWRVLHRMLQERVSVQAVVRTPLRWLPPGLSSQVWFRCQRPAQTS